MSETATPNVGLHYRVPLCGQGWELPEEVMPESVLHDEAVALLRSILSWWAAKRGDTLITRNLAVRWDEERPNVGVDPDVAVFRPIPHNASDLRSVKTWLEDHRPPIVAIEVVSETNPHKDYVVAPEKYAASGTGELWVFDPLLTGPAVRGGPYRLQIWARRDDGDWERTDAGEGPFRSRALNAWLVVVDEGRRLRVADQRDATHFWLTGEEAERAAKDAERAAKDAERLENEKLRARIAELEAKGRI